MTWPLQSPDLNPVEMVLGRDAPHGAHWENTKSLQSSNQSKGWLFWRIKNVLSFLFATYFHMGSFLELIPSVIIYNVNSSKNKKAIEEPSYKTTCGYGRPIWRPPSVCSIYQGNAWSTLLFCISLNPMRGVIDKNIRYQLWLWEGGRASVASSKMQRIRSLSTSERWPPETRC